MSYTKLANSILTSTIWMEDDHTRIVWLTMLAMADKNGEVQGSIPGLAHAARVPVESCHTAIKKFLSPDPHSRTKDDEGRRIEEIRGGWFLINHHEYRELSSDDDRRRKAADRQQRYRDKLKRNADGVTGCDKSHQISHADADADTKAKKEREEEDFSLPKAELSAEQQAEADRLTFKTPPNTWADQFIETYPKKTAPNDVEAALEVEIVNLRNRHGWDDQRCVDHLLAKAAEYAASKFVATCPRKEMPSPALWLKAGRYREDPAEWDIDASGSKPRTPAKAKVPRFDAGRKSADDKLGSDLLGLAMQ